MLFISSHHQSENESSTLVIKQGDEISRKTGILNGELRSHGTKVTVHNLFGGLPVRFKQNALRFNDSIEVLRQFGSLQRLLVSYLLASGARVSLQLRSAAGDLRYTHVAGQLPTEQRFSSDRIAGTFRQAGLSDTSSCWKLASAKARDLSIGAAISLTPLPTKQSQFISFGRQPIPAAGFGAILYESINTLFDMSAFGIIEDAGYQTSRPAAMKNPDYTQASLRSKLIKGVDRWPAFYIRINLPSEQIAQTHSVRHDFESGGSATFQNVLALLKILIGQFLNANQFRPKRVRRRRQAGLESRNQTSSNAFHVWKRTKIGHNMTVDELCDGLPLTPAADTEGEEPLSEDIRLLLQDIELNPDIVDDDAQGGSDGAPITDNTVSDVTISWTNPRSGHVLYLDTSSGCIACLQSNVQEDEAAPDLARPTTASDSCQRLPKSTLTRRELARRLSKWPSRGFATESEPPIPSVVIEEPNHPVPEECCQTVEAAALATAHVLRQVDEKFILATVPGSGVDTCSLVLIDQHAADERIKVEAFYQQLCDGQRVSLGRPMMFEVSEEEAKLLKQAQSFFASWAMEYQLAQRESLEPQSDSQNTVVITHLPSMIAERCRLEPRIVIDMLRREIWCDNHVRHWQAHKHADSSWITRIAHCPASLLEMVNSRACRSAIMFNDVLNNDQCQELLRRLSECALPFQCAHGRPSMVVLTAFGKQKRIGSTEQDEETFGSAFRHWDS